MKSRTIIETVLLLGGFVLVGCDASTDPDSPGSCTLKCNKPKVGSVDYEMMPLTETKLSYFCSMAGDANDRNANDGITANNGPVQFRFQIYEKIDFSNTPDADQTLTPATQKVPKANVGFEPWILAGSPALEYSNAALKTSATTVSQFKFAGVVTPPSEWCSDSCGVITFEVWPNCISSTANAIKATAVAGSTKPAEPIEVELKALSGD